EISRRATIPGISAAMLYSLRTPGAMPMLHIFSDAPSVADYVSSALVEKIRSRPEVVLGLATGGTMEPIYARFVDQARRQRLDVSRLTSFNLDEYVGLSADHPKSYSAYMRHHLFGHLGFDSS